MTEGLANRTALLPHITLQEPECAIGKSTEQAMLAGAVYGYRGLVREILHNLNKEFANDPLSYRHWRRRPHSLPVAWMKSLISLQTSPSKD